MNKNIYLAYLLTVCKNSWFWLGIWVFYYLRFTNYAGIGIVETVLITAMVLTEIPTGAIADLFGKKKTLFLSFLIMGIGGFWMALTPDFVGLTLSVLVLGIGSSLYSGTMEALAYDTLKEQGKESGYDRVIATISSIQLATAAICSIVGGFLYTISPNLPFITNSVFYFVGMIASIFLVEPIIDTYKFSFKNYISQTKQGLKQLFKTVHIKKQTLLLLSVGGIAVIVDEMLSSFLGIEFGFKEEFMGILWAGIYVLTSFASQLTPRVKKLFGEQSALIIVGFLFALTLLLSPILGLVTGGIILVLSSSLQSIYGNLTSMAINENTESKYRATTISTFNMMKNIPYVLCAYLFGTLSDAFTAKVMALSLGLILAILLIIQGLMLEKGKSDKSIFIISS